VTALLAWIIPELIDALSDALPERPGALPQSERLKQIID
jgi:hypothetical protein